MRYCCVGAGFSGAVIARTLADAGHQVLVVDERSHAAGNCHTARDAETGVMVHVYGPHIFHTGNERVWRYAQRFATMVPYHHRVYAVVCNRVYSLPINLLTINQFFSTTMGPQEARSFIAAKSEAIQHPCNFEEQALSMLGEELYRAFFRGYSRKQWGIEPRKLPAHILKRLPLRFNYENSYFDHPHQAIPMDGYTKMVERILDAANIEVRLGCRFEDLDEEFAHVLYSGPIDRYFHHDLGRLGYRTLDFETLRVEGDFQGTAVINYCDEEIPYTRITEHKYFAPWELDAVNGSVCYKEFSRSCGPGDVPYYPIRLVAEQTMLARYVDRARLAADVTFVGRLGTYRYLDMDVTIAEALETADQLVARIAEGAPLPVFFIDP